MTFDTNTLDILQAALERLDAGFDDLPAYTPDIDHDAVRAVLLDVADKMRDNYPYQHPFYAGQMLKPPHPVARLAYALAQYINPNNHALDGGRASSAMEKDAVAQIAAMVGWDAHLGHLTSGGTMANLEALWVAGRLRPGETIAASSQAHYTHSRISEVLGLPFVSVPTDARGRMDVDALEDLLDEGEIGTVVVTMGTTAVGSVDPLVDVLALREKYGFRVHLDAAYGGYFTLADNLDPDTRAHYDAMHQADSFAIDPHKHGLQPYGCGCIVFRDPAVGALYKHDSPYTYFSSAELHLGEISLECSRAGAAAVALWATMRLFPLEKGGAFADMLTTCRAAALDFHARVENSPRWLTPFTPELDIAIYAPRAETASAISAKSRAIFDQAARAGLHLAVATLPRKLLEPGFDGVRWDADRVSVLRSVFMKPEHLAWMDAIWTALDGLNG